jgi:hypothetical protein
MAKITVEIRGTNRVRNQLRAAASFHSDVADRRIKKHARAEQKRLRNKPYPPERPNQTYKRKRFFGGIAGSFSVTKKKPGVWGIVNSRPYASYVIGKKQAWMHKGRWWMMREELQSNMPELTKALTQALEDKLNGAGS